MFIREFRDRIRLAALAVIALMATTGQSPAADSRRDQVKLSTGFDYSSGSYGAARDTQIWSLPVTAKYVHDAWTFKVSVPYLQITGPGGVVAGDGAVVVGNATSQQVTTASGWGDVVMGITYSLDPLTDYMPFIDLTAKVKAPTANENRGLGTGEADYTLKADFSKTFGAITPFATIGYRFVGNPPGSNLRDTFLASVGADYRLNEKFSTGLIFDYRQSTSRTSQDPAELTPYLNYKITKAVSANLYTVVGFSHGSPDNGVGLQLSYAM